jgi:hypothetical protein
MDHSRAGPRVEGLVGWLVWLLLRVGGVGRGRAEGVRVGR